MGHIQSFRQTGSGRRWRRARPFRESAFPPLCDAAQAVFGEWRSDLEKRLRGETVSPALESHFAKYRKLVPALALVGRLADSGAGPIGEKALLRALAFADFLQTHARRAYGAGAASEAAAAKLILSRIRKGELSEVFSPRDIRRKEWSGLTDNDQIKASVDLLADLDWIAPKTIETTGRPRTEYAINPRALR